MDTKSILDEASFKTGWDETSMLDIVCEYVDNQQSEGAFRDFVMQKMDEEITLDDFTPPPLTQEQVTSYMEGRWFTPKEQVAPLWIIPTDVDCADVGPDGEVLDTLQKACRGNWGTLPSDFDYESLGLEEVPAHARRYNEKDGFYIP